MENFAQILKEESLLAKGFIIDSKQKPDKIIADIIDLIKDKGNSECYFHIK